jgi:hypothetical protein
VEKRKQQRSRRRLTCELVVDGRRWAAIVRDLSATGLFVQTRARPQPNSLVEIVFPEQDGRAEFRVEAGVARERVVPPRLQAAVPEGVGLEVLDPPPAFHELVAKGAAAFEAEPAAGAERSAQGPVRTFRIRMTERDKPNARVLTVRAHNLEGARARALAQMGRAWKIAEIQEI